MVFLAFSLSAFSISKSKLSTLLVISSPYLHFNNSN
jgi:hypothetical protein